MVAWRIVGILALALAAGPVWGQEYLLAETPKAGDCCQIQMGLKLTGEMRVIQEGKTLPIKLTAVARHEFVERVLAAGANGLIAKSARWYDVAKAEVVAGEDTTEKKLREQRRFLVAQRTKDQLCVFSPAGAMFGDEVELTNDHFDTLALAGLLPGKAVAVGGDWKIANEVAQALCHFEGLIAHELVGKLVEVKDDLAKFTVQGSAGGIDLGAQVKLTVDARGHFDLKKKRLVFLDWKQQDDRSQGPASPASKVEAHTVLKRTILEEKPETLSDVALVAVPDDAEPPGHLVQVFYRDPKERFVFVHSREWQLVGQMERHVILRLLDRGDLVAQATITPWTKAEAGKHLQPAELKEIMAKTPAWEVEEVLDDGVVLEEGGRWVYRLTARGDLDNQKVVQSYYVVAGPDGDQALVVFTMGQGKVDKLGTCDLALIGSLEFPKKK